MQQHMWSRQLEANGFDLWFSSEMPNTYCDSASYIQLLTGWKSWTLAVTFAVCFLSVTGKRYREGKEGQQINQVDLNWRLNQYNLSTLPSHWCCDSPVLEVGSVLYFSYSVPPQPTELPVDWCGKHCPHSHPQWQMWKVGHCAKRPGQ